MKVRCPTLCLVAVVLALVPRGALADAQGCPPLAVDADEQVLALWPELPERLRDALAAREGLDTCVQVELRHTNSSITVQVTLRDGRSASRDVPEQDDVVPALEALLLLPASERAAQQSLAAPTTAPAAAPGRKPVRERLLPVTGEAIDRDRAPSSGRGLGLELSLLTSARIGDGQTAWGLAALSFIDVSGWLAGFEGRASGYTNMQRAQTYPSLQLALLGGHRLRFSSTSLDFLAGPAVALLGENTTEEGPAAEPQTNTGIVPRFVLGSHLQLGTRSVLRTFVGIEGEFGPAGPSGDGLTAPPPLPAWMVGVALGATVGTI